MNLHQSAVAPRGTARLSAAKSRSSRLRSPTSSNQTPVSAAGRAGIATPRTRFEVCREALAGVRSTSFGSGSTVRPRPRKRVRLARRRAATTGSLGPSVRDRGSIHSDIWRGSAAALAERDAIGIFPVSGWWKEKPALQRWDRAVRYALIVSVRAPGANIDIYTPIAIQLAIPIPAA